MAIVNEETRQKISEGVEHVKLHLETSGRFTERLVPSIQRDFTNAKIVAMLGNKALEQRAISILKHHHLMQPNEKLQPSRQGDNDTCILAKTTGIPGSYEQILGLRFLEVHERLVLLEFVQRFDMGEYPHLTLPPVQTSRTHATTD